VNVGLLSETFDRLPPPLPLRFRRRRCRPGGRAPRSARRTPRAPQGLQPGSLQSGEDWPDGPGRANKPQPPGDELRAILAAVDPDRVEAIVRKLVSFGTRHTLSDQDNPERGIGAARDWIFAR
jgi:hypothetical protein